MSLNLLTLIGNWVWSNLSQRKPLNYLKQKNKKKKTASEFFLFFTFRAKADGALIKKKKCSGFVYCNLWKWRKKNVSVVIFKQKVKS